MAARQKVLVHTMGGLGNQMFQYASARALASRCDAELVLDPWTGFVRDHVFKRHYELGVFPVRARLGHKWEGLPFWSERVRIKLGSPTTYVISRRWGGDYLQETEQRFYDEVATYRSRRSVFMHGHWQSERYFYNVRDQIAADLTPSAPTDERARAMGSLMQASNAVAVGIRLFEEMPGGTKAEVGGLTSLEFYNAAARRLAAGVPNPVFFVFCTRTSEALSGLDLPGPVHYVTANQGFENAVDSLWLLSQCAHHIAANSSFFWWGAWLAEQRHAHSRIIVSPRFPNPATVPTRWEALTTT